MIVVANDAVIQDPLRMSLMKMSAPANCGLKILSVEKAGLFSWILQSGRPEELELPVWKHRRTPCQIIQRAEIQHLNGTYERRTG